MRIFFLILWAHQRVYSKKELGTLKLNTYKNAKVLDIFQRGALDTLYLKTNRYVLIKKLTLFFFLGRKNLLHLIYLEAFFYTYNTLVNIFQIFSKNKNIPNLNNFKFWILWIHVINTSQDNIYFPIRCIQKLNHFGSILFSNFESYFVFLYYKPKHT